jgi:hypothetical protein
MEPIRESQFQTPRRASARLRPGRRGALAAGFALAAGLALRLWMLPSLFAVDGDSLVYGGLAKNLLLHGRYALTAANGELFPTLIRLPGYPLYLALCFRLFGMENYFAAACLQIVLELVGCLLLAGFARRMAQALRPGDDRLAGRAALATLWLAALCPFTASYAAAPLSEAPTLFMLALAMWAMARFCERPGWGAALWFTFAVTAAALLRPDGALAAVAFVPALLMALRPAAGQPQLFRAPSFPHPFAERAGDRKSRRKHFRMAIVCILLALAPFAAWTWRNWHVFGVFEPLAPRLATDPGEDTYPGWESWVKSWCLDFVSTYEIYWSVPGDTLEVDKLPARAFDSPAQYAATAALFRDYNTHGKELTPELDERFAALARERLAAHPLRSRLWLPLGRMADMWLRPRVENLPIDLDWWNYARHRAETRFSWIYLGLNAFYLLLAVAGLCLRPRFWKPLAAYMLLRSALLLTVEAPEARYTLECFPMLFALGGVALAAGMTRSPRSGRQTV